VIFLVVILLVGCPNEMRDPVTTRLCSNRDFSGKF
jgi:hypothetical protein